MNKLIIIAALGENFELGKNNDLIWKVKEDLQFFKNKTMNHHILMGKNTFLSLPSLLVKRTHLVFSRTLQSDALPHQVILLKNLKEFYEYFNSISDDVYIIGGASLYKQFINEADLMYLTFFKATCQEADSYFPKFAEEDFVKTSLGEFANKSLTYKRVLYQRKS